MVYVLIVKTILPLIKQKKETVIQDSSNTDAQIPFEDQQSSQIPEVRPTQQDNPKIDPSKIEIEKIHEKTRITFVVDLKIAEFFTVRTEKKDYKIFFTDGEKEIEVATLLNGSIIKLNTAEVSEHPILKTAFDINSIKVAKVSTSSK